MKKFSEAYALVKHSFPSKSVRSLWTAPYPVSHIRIFAIESLELLSDSECDETLDSISKVRLSSTYHNFQIENEVVIISKFEAWHECTSDAFRSIQASSCEIVEQQCFMSKTSLQMHSTVCVNYNFAYFQQLCEQVERKILSKFHHESIAFVMEKSNWTTTKFTIKTSATITSTGKCIGCLNQFIPVIVEQSKITYKIGKLYKLKMKSILVSTKRFIESCTDRYYIGG